MNSLLTKFSIFLFIFCLPPGNLLFVFFDRDVAFNLSKIITFLLVFYWAWDIIYRRINFRFDWILLSLFLISVCYLIIGIYHGEFSNGLTGFFRIIALVFFYLLIFSYKDKTKFIYFFINLAVVSSIGVILAFVISVFFPDGFFTFSNPDDRDSVFFIFSTSNAIYQFGNVSFARMAFFFDEPGTLAFFIFFAYICSERMHISSSKKFLLIIAGSLTASIAFIILLACYYVIDLILNRRFFLFSFIVFAISLVGFALMQTEFSIVINKLLIGRLESIVDGGAGNTRSDVMNVALNLFLSNWQLGVGFNTSSVYPFFGANIFYFVAIGGLLFIPLYFPVLPLFFYIIFNFKNIGVVVTAVMCIFQRPDYLLPYGFFSLICLLEILRSSSGICYNDE